MRSPLLEIRNNRNAGKKYFPLIVMFLLMGGFAFLFYMNMLSKKELSVGHAETSVEQLIIDEVENGRAKEESKKGKEGKEKEENFTFYKTLVKDPMKPNFDPNLELKVQDSEAHGEVALDKEIDRPLKKETVTANPVFSVQVAAFADFDRADQMLRQLKAQGYDPFILAAISNGDTKRYRVRFGKYKTATEATEESKRINMARNWNSIVVKD